jgi:PKD repeat protein
LFCVIPPEDGQQGPKHVAAKIYNITVNITVVAQDGSSNNLDKVRATGCKTPK